MDYPRLRGNGGRGRQRGCPTGQRVLERRGGAMGSTDARKRNCYKPLQPGSLAGGRAAQVAKHHHAGVIQRKRRIVA